MQLASERGKTGFTDMNRGESMKFYTSSDMKRPIRLCEKTRQFAFDSINYKYGRDTLKTPNVSLDYIEEFDGLSDIKKYNTAIYEIVTKAPIRICEGELLSGAATLGDAINHRVPAVYRGEEYVSTSHLTVGFEEVLEIGINGMRKKAEESLKKHTEPEKHEFLKSCIHCFECIEIWHKRYIEALSEKEGYERVLENLKRVPFSPAKNFYEAVQSVWFCFAFLRLCGDWPGIGRIDVLLGKYLKNDLKNGKITIDEAREILAHFFIKGCEWITGYECGSGDAQHYQNLVISGIDEDGNDVTNEVTYLVLDIIEETGISDFPTTVRINKNTDETLLRRVAEVIRFGGGIIAVYNENLVLKSLEDMGYSGREARKFANDGCWEVQIPGKTNFSYVPFDGLKILQHITLRDYDSGVEFKSFDDLLSTYKEDLSRQIGEIYKIHIQARVNGDGSFIKNVPCTTVSLFEQACIERGLSYQEGGTVYTVISPHFGGLPDVANSLYAIKKAVFDDKAFSFSEFMNILKNNWEDAEDSRKRVLNDYKYFGNDNDEADEIAVKIADAFTDICKTYDGKTPIRFISGISTFGRQIEWAPDRLATPFGRKKGEVLSGNLSPTPGTDFSGAASIIKSYCKINLIKQHSGAALDIRFSPKELCGENGIQAIIGLIRAFCNLGGFFMQLDTVSRETLIDAKEHPENYKNLSVRVSGWSARFVTMSREWQDMIIERT